MTIDVAFQASLTLFHDASGPCSWIVLLDATVAPSSLRVCIKDANCGILTLQRVIF